MSKEIKNLKQYSQAADRFQGAHLLCPGCAHGMIVRELINATDDDIMMAVTTGCLEVSTAIYPNTSYDFPWIHIGFENAATAMSGAEAMQKALARKGKLYTPDRKCHFIAIGGDGATYDIGFQWISGAFERGHQLIYVCLDNEVYANTGGQRSGSTPMGASTVTSPAGRVSYGKKVKKKDIVGIFAAHKIPYVAQVAPNQWKDMSKKLKKAFDTNGPVFINAMSACTTEWRFEANRTVEISDIAIDACVFPLYEIENGTKLTITYRPKNKIPVREYLGVQGRFAHLFKKGNEHVIEEFQKNVDEFWDYLQRREEAGV